MHAEQAPSPNLPPALFRSEPGLNLDIIFSPNLPPRRR